MQRRIASSRSTSPATAARDAPPLRAGMAWFADAVADALEAERVRGAIVVGHSFGGHLALHLALRRTELVGALCWSRRRASAPRTRFVQAVIAASTFVRPGRLVARARGRYAARGWFRRAVFQPLFVSDADPFSERATLGFLSGQAEHRNTAIAGRAMVADDPRAELAVCVPCHRAVGRADAQLPLDDAFEYARRLRAPLRVVADCGHLVIGERPDSRPRRGSAPRRTRGDRPKRVG